MPIVKLTPQLIAAYLTCPPGKIRVEFCDADLPASLRLRANGEPGSSPPSPGPRVATGHRHDGNGASGRDTAATILIN